MRLLKFIKRFIITKKIVKLGKSMIKKPERNTFRFKMGVMRTYLRIPNNVVLVASIKGNIAKEDLKEALKKVNKMHPLIGARVVTDNKHEAWFTDEGVSPISLKVIKRTSDRQWIDIVENQEIIPFDFEKGPLIRFILLQSEEISDIIIICQHSICDGISLINLIQDIILLLSEPETEVKKIETVLPTSNNFTPVPFRFKLKLLKNKLIMSIINRKWNKQPVFFDEEDYQNVHEAYFQKYSHKIIELELSKGETSALIKKCRKNHVTVNSALSSALLAAKNDILGESPKKNPLVQIAVNVRNELKKPSENVFGFLASGIRIEFKYLPGKTLWENISLFHRKVASDLKGKKALEPLIGYSISSTLTEAINFAMYGRWVSNGFSRYDKLSRFIKSDNKAVKISKNLISSMPVLMISNLGQIEIQKDFEPLKISRLFFATSSSPFSDLVVGAVTLNGKLTLTLSYMEPEEERSDFLCMEREKILNSAIERLKRA